MVTTATQINIAASNATPYVGFNSIYSFLSNYKRKMTQNTLINPIIDSTPNQCFLPSHLSSISLSIETSISGGGGGGLASFLLKTYDMVDNSSTNG